MEGLQEKLEALSDMKIEGSIVLQSPPNPKNGSTNQGSQFPDVVSLRNLKDTVGKIKQTNDTEFADDNSANLIEVVSSHPSEEGNLAKKVASSAQKGTNSTSAEAIMRITSGNINIATSGNTNAFTGNVNVAASDNMNGTTGPFPNATVEATARGAQYPEIVVVDPLKELEETRTQISATSQKIQLAKNVSVTSQVKVDLSVSKVDLSVNADGSGRGKSQDNTSINVTGRMIMSPMSPLSPPAGERVVETSVIESATPENQQSEDVQPERLETNEASTAERLEPLEAQPLKLDSIVTKTGEAKPVETVVIPPGSSNHEAAVPEVPATLQDSLAQERQRRVQRVLAQRKRRTYDISRILDVMSEDNRRSKRQIHGVQQRHVNIDGDMEGDDINAANLGNASIGNNGIDVIDTHKTLLTDQSGDTGTKGMSTKGYGEPCGAGQGPLTSPFKSTAAISKGLKDATNDLIQLCETIEAGETGHVHKSQDGQYTMLKGKRSLEYVPYSIRNAAWGANTTLGNEPKQRANTTPGDNVIYSTAVGEQKVHHSTFHNAASGNANVEFAFNNQLGIYAAFQDLQAKHEGQIQIRAGTACDPEMNPKSALVTRLANLAANDVTSWIGAKNQNPPDDKSATGTAGLSGMADNTGIAEQAVSSALSDIYTRSFTQLNFFEGGSGVQNGSVVVDENGNCLDKEGKPLTEKPSTDGEGSPVNTKISFSQASSKEGGAAHFYPQISPETHWNENLPNYYQNFGTWGFEHNPENTKNNLKKPDDSDTFGTIDELEEGSPGPIIPPNTVIDGRLLNAGDEKLTLFYTSSVCDFDINDNDEQIKARVTPFIGGNLAACNIQNQFAYDNTDGIVDGDSAEEELGAEASNSYHRNKKQAGKEPINVTLEALPEVEKCTSQSPRRRSSFEVPSGPVEYIKTDGQHTKFFDPVTNCVYYFPIQPKKDRAEGEEEDEAPLQADPKSRKNSLSGDQANLIGQGGVDVLSVSRGLALQNLNASNGGGFLISDALSNTVRHLSGTVVDVDENGVSLSSMNKINMVISEEGFLSSKKQKKPSKERSGKKRKGDDSVLDGTRESSVYDGDLNSSGGRGLETSGENSHMLLSSASKKSNGGGNMDSSGVGSESSSNLFNCFETPQFNIGQAASRLLLLQGTQSHSEDEKGMTMLESQPQNTRDARKVEHTFPNIVTSSDALGDAGPDQYSPSSVGGWSTAPPTVLQSNTVGHYNGMQDGLMGTNNTHHTSVTVLKGSQYVEKNTAHHIPMDVSSNHEIFINDENHSHLESNSLEDGTKVHSGQPGGQGGERGSMASTTTGQQISKSSLDTGSKLDSSVGIGGKGGLGATTGGIGGKGGIGNRSSNPENAAGGIGGKKKFNFADDIFAYNESPEKARSGFKNSRSRSFAASTAHEAHRLSTHAISKSDLRGGLGGKAKGARTVENLGTIISSGEGSKDSAQGFKSSLKTSSKKDPTGSASLVDRSSGLDRSQGRSKETQDGLDRSEGTGGEQSNLTNSTRSKRGTKYVPKGPIRHDSEENDNASLCSNRSNRSIRSNRSGKNSQNVHSSQNITNPPVGKMSSNTTLVTPGGMKLSKKNLLAVGGGNTAPPPPSPLDPSQPKLMEDDLISLRSENISVRAPSVRSARSAGQQSCGHHSTGQQSAGQHSEKSSQSVGSRKSYASSRQQPMSSQASENADGRASQNGVPTFDEISKSIEKLNRDSKNANNVVDDLGELLNRSLNQDTSESPGDHEGGESDRSFNPLDADPGADPNDPQDGDRDGDNETDDQEYSMTEKELDTFSSSIKLAVNGNEVANVRRGNFRTSKSQSFCVTGNNIGNIGSQLVGTRNNSVGGRAESGMLGGKIFGPKEVPSLETLRRDFLRNNQLVVGGGKAVAGAVPPPSPCAGSGQQAMGQQGIVSLPNIREPQRSSSLGLKPSGPNAPKSSFISTEPISLGTVTTPVITSNGSQQLLGQSQQNLTRTLQQEESEEEGDEIEFNTGVSLTLNEDPFHSAHPAAKQLSDSTKQPGPITTFNIPTKPNQPATRSSTARYRHSCITLGTSLSGNNGGVKQFSGSFASVGGGPLLSTLSPQSQPQAKAQPHEDHSRTLSVTASSTTQSKEPWTASLGDAPHPKLSEQAPHPQESSRAILGNSPQHSQRVQLGQMRQSEPQGAESIPAPREHQQLSQHPSQPQAQTMQPVYPGQHHHAYPSQHPGQTHPAYPAYPPIPASGGPPISGHPSMTTRHPSAVYSTPPTSVMPPTDGYPPQHYTGIPPSMPGMPPIGAYGMTTIGYPYGMNAMFRPQLPVLNLAAAFAPQNLISENLTGIQSVGSSPVKQHPGGSPSANRQQHPASSPNGSPHSKAVTTIANKSQDSTQAESSMVKSESQWLGELEDKRRRLECQIQDLAKTVARVQGVPEGSQYPTNSHHDHQDEHCHHETASCSGHETISSSQTADVLLDETCSPMHVHPHKQPKAKLVSGEKPHRHRNQQKKNYYSGKEGRQYEEQASTVVVSPQHYIGSQQNIEYFHPVGGQPCQDDPIFRNRIHTVIDRQYHQLHQTENPPLYMKTLPDTETVFPSFESISDCIKAQIQDRVYSLSIDKYADDREGDIGCVFQVSKCRAYSDNLFDICNTNVILKPALLVQKLKKHGYFETALRKILPNYQKRLETGEKVYVSAVNNQRGDLHDMFITMKTSRSILVEIIIA